MTGALLAAALAHPVGTVPASEALVVRVFRDRVEVSDLAEVPVELLAARGNGREPAEDLAVELEVGLALGIDGARTELAPIARRVEPGRTEHTVGIALELAAPLPPGPHTIRLRSSNLADARVARSADVWVVPGLAVREASTLVTRDGSLVRDDSGRWRADLSEVTVTVDPEPAGWSALLGRGAAPEHARLAPRGLARLADLEPAALGALALAVVSARALSAPPIGPRAAGAAVGVALVAAPLRDAPTDLGAAALALALLPWPALAVPAALAALVATTHHLGPAALLAALVALPGPAAREPRPHLAAALVGTLVLARGLAGTFG